MSRPSYPYHLAEGWRKHGYTIEAVRAWRAQELAAGRPSKLDDFYRAHGLCLECRGNGNKLVGCRWHDGQGNERQEPLRPGVNIATLVDRYLEEGQEWEYVYETCEACSGTGKSKPQEQRSDLAGETK